MLKASESNRNRDISVIILILLFTIAVLAAAGFSTSPFYSIYYGDYYNNNTNAAILIGKAWAEGIIPYRDLFGTDGPFYYFMQMIGYVISGTTGIWCLQILALSGAFYICYLTLNKIVSRKTSLILTFCTLIAYAIMGSGGNSSCEWCLLPLSWMLWISINAIQKKNFSVSDNLTMGLMTGVMFMTWMMSGLVGLGIWIGVTVSCMENNRGIIIKKIIAWLGGCLLPLVIFCVYFMSKGTLNDFLTGTIIYNIYAIGFGNSGISLIMRKVLKCLPQFLMLIAVILLKNDNRMSVFRPFFLISTLVSLFVLLPGNGYWHYYLLYVLFWPLIIATLFESDCSVKLIADGLYALLLIGILILPAVHAMNHVISLDTETSEVMISDISDNMEILESDSIYVINGPDYIYLELNIVPPYKYFTNQSELFSFSDVIYDDLWTWLETGYENGIVTCSTNSGLSQTLGAYTYVTVYTMNHSAVGIYLYDPVSE